jgi:hypothetical protein
MIAWRYTTVKILYCSEMVEAVLAGGIRLVGRVYETQQHDFELIGSGNQLLDVPPLQLAPASFLRIVILCQGFYTVSPALQIICQLIPIRLEQPNRQRAPVLWPGAAPLT